MKNLFILLIVVISIYVGEAEASPIPAEKLFNNADSSLLKFSPNGKFISIYFSSDDGKKLSLFDINTGEIHNIAGFDTNQYLYNYNWINDQALIAKVSTNGKISQFILPLDFKDDVVTTAPSQLMLKGEIKGFLPNHPDTVLFSEKNGSKLGYTLYYASVQDLLDNALKNSKKVANLYSAEATYFYDEDAEKLISILINAEQETVDLHYKPLQSGDWSPLLSLKKVDYSFTPVGFLSEQTLAVLSNKGTDKIALHEFDIASQSFTKVLFEHEKYDLSSANVSSETGQVESIIYFDHGRFTADYFAESQKREAELVRLAFPDKQFLITAVNDKTGNKILKTIAADDPGTYYLFDTQALTAEKLTHTSQPLSSYKMDKTKAINVTSDDGTEIEAFLTQPQGFNQNVLLVMPHGGPIGVREYDVFNPTVQYFASRGFSVLRVNFRGSTGYGKRFMEEGVAQLGKIIEKDISQVVTKVISENSYDKTCAIGASYGGFSSFLLAINHPEIYDCIVASYGLYDLPLWFNGSNLDVYSEDYRQSVVNTIGEMSDELFDVSPVYLADKVTVPVLLIAGKDDKITGFEHSNRMEYALRKYSKTVETLNYANTGHGHTNWWGEWHEHAYIHDYLLRTLALKAFAIEEIKEEDKEQLGDEIVRIADSFNFSDNVENDEALAWKYYNKAAQFDDAHSLYNIGFFYFHGVHVEKDTAKAMELFNRASTLESSAASYELGTRYYEGTNVTQDYDLSLKMFQLATAQEHEASANLMIARAKCLGLGTARNLSECIEMLKISYDDNDVEGKSKVTKRSFRRLGKAVFDILVAGEYSPEELKLVQDAISEQFEIDVFPIKIREEEHGEYFASTSIFGNAKFTEFEQIAPKDGLSFGVNFDVVPKAMFGDNSKKTGIGIRWTKHLVNGESTIESRIMQFGSRYDWHSYFTLDKNNLQPAVWEVEIFDMQGKKLYNKRFNLTLAPALGEL
jgi:prolyl oligopeptidase PreP (S9A serine peptidase family)